MKNSRNPFGQIFPAALALALICGFASLRAADSTFSLNNRFVYVAGSKSPSLEEIDLTGKTRRMIDLSAHLDEPIVAVSADSSGALV